VADTLKHYLNSVSSGLGAIVKIRFGLIGVGLILAVMSRSSTGQIRETVVYERVVNEWFEGPLTRMQIAGDGAFAAFALLGGGRSLQFVPLNASTQKEPENVRGFEPPIEAVMNCGPGFAFKGKRGTERGWFIPNGSALNLSSAPPQARLKCSANLAGIAYYLSGGSSTNVFLTVNGKTEEHKITGRITGAAFSPDGSAFYALAFSPDERSVLYRITPGNTDAHIIADNIDASPFETGIAVSPDGRSVFIPLASSEAPLNADRHIPRLSRWLKIYRLDVSNGARHVVTESNNDNVDPTVVNGALYWNRIKLRQQIVIVPINGGEAKSLVSDGELPMWSPDGKRISYSIGDWRLADWALNLDVAYSTVDIQKQTASAPKNFVKGYHEDFPAAWSPDGHWIAFHSHRSKTPVAAYDSPGSADDIFLRRAEDLNAPEIRLTNFGWETWPAFWSPDGRKLICSSWEKGGQPGIDKLWVLTIDPATGSLLSTEKLPLSPEIHSPEWPAWSPDGKEIAVVDNLGSGKRSIWIMQLNGTHAQKLVDFTSSTSGGVSWSGDGKTLVYSGLADGHMQLFSIARSDGSPRQLSHDSGNLMHPAISPDGKWIACTRVVQSAEIHRLPL
jgi:Tol biopolymer transport system component